MDSLKASLLWVMFATLRCNIGICLCKIIESSGPSDG